ncbi:small integral membrane protein 30-like [Branchiostoma floridae x Branchiostoma japonicum]
MAELWQVLLLSLQVLAFFLPGAQAFDGGDAVALILGLIIGILGICACLGCYARRRAGA